MKKLFCVLLAVVMLAGLAIGAGAINTRPGEITDDEIRVFFNENRELLQDIAEQLLSLAEELIEGDSIFLSIYSSDLQILAWDSINSKPVALPDPLLRQAALCFGLEGVFENAWITARFYARTNALRIVDFELWPGYSTGPYSGGLKMLVYMDPDGWNHDRLDNNWGISVLCIDFEPPLRWWEKLPSFLQFLLRWFCFGWIWMR